jgi:uncharacterized protein
MSLAHHAIVAQTCKIKKLRARAMSRKLFVNLPVRDLKKSVQFFTALGFTFNPKFTDENATCMIVSDDAFVMLLVEPYFSTFVSKPIAAAHTCTETMLALSCESRVEVEEMVRKAVAAGGTTPREARDLGFMFQHGFDDLDGHAWEVVWMNPSALPPRA